MISFNPKTYFGKYPISSSGYDVLVLMFQIFTANLLLEIKKKIELKHLGI